jgi:hypothetical protein
MEQLAIVDSPEDNQMETQAIEPKVNLQMVESILQLIRSLPIAERQVLEQHLAVELTEYPEVRTQELMQIAEHGGAFDFLHDEPDLYTLEDGEPIQGTTAPALKRSVLEILAEAHQLPAYRTPAEIDRDIQAERDSWDN